MTTFYSPAGSRLGKVPPLTQSVSLVRERHPPRIVSLVARPVNIQIDLRRTALIVVDMQNDFCHPDGWFGCSGIDVKFAQPVFAPIQRLMQASRSHKMPVIHLHWSVRSDRLEMSLTQQWFGAQFGQRAGFAEVPTGGRGPALLYGSWGAEALPGLEPEADDIVVYKNRFSGFWNNELDAILRGLDISTLMFCGVNTERCVLASLLDASFLGYDVVLIEDATTTVAGDTAQEAALTLIRSLYGFTTLHTTLVNGMYDFDD